MFYEKFCFVMAHMDFNFFFGNFFFGGSGTLLKKFCNVNFLLFLTFFGVNMVTLDY